MKHRIFTLFAALIITLGLAAQTTITQGAKQIKVGNQVVATFPASSYDSIVVIVDLGVKVYVHGRESQDFLDAVVEELIVTPDEPFKPSDDKANLNRNTNFVGLKQHAWRLEYPKLRETPNNLVSVIETPGVGINYSLEYDTDLKATRWVAYQFHNGLPDNRVGRTNHKWEVDANIPAKYCIKSSDYDRVGYDRGHLCPSNDRQTTKLQNEQTFITSNCLPQIQGHNRGVWSNLEAYVKGLGEDRNFCDTLYVVKAATIERLVAPYLSDDYAGIEGYTEPDKANGQQIIIPKYFYMVLLAVKDKKYKGVAIWTRHLNVEDQKTKKENFDTFFRTIDDVERLTGIDFFCNLPDALEVEVEKSFDKHEWRY